MAEYKRPNKGDLITVTFTKAVSEAGTEDGEHFIEFEDGSVLAWEKKVAAPEYQQTKRYPPGSVIAYRTKSSKTMNLVYMVPSAAEGRSTPVEGWYNHFGTRIDIDETRIVRKLHIPGQHARTAFQETKTDEQ